MLDVDLARPLQPQLAGLEEGVPWGGAWILVRVLEEPVGALQIALPRGERDRLEMRSGLAPAVVTAVEARLRAAGISGEVGSKHQGSQDGCAPAASSEYLARRARTIAAGQPITAVVCTREHPRGLARCLATLQAQSYPRAEILVVDNASRTDETKEVTLSSRGPLPVRYVSEPRPGLSRARNRSLEEVQTELIAWIDDDEIADPQWLCEVVGAFTTHPEAAAVCGVMVPAEIMTPPQFWFEEYGGHNKGRGFTPAVFSPATAHLQSPLFPLPPFGTGGNMAMRVRVIRELGGFNRALGAGTRAMGAEDTRALTEILLGGGTVVYQPTAITRHFHRRDYEGLRRQLYGYGAGLSAFYTSLALERPALLLPLFRLLPRALGALRDPDGVRFAGISAQFPADLLREHRRGMLRGPFAYAAGRLRR